MKKDKEVTKMTDFEKAEETLTQISHRIMDYQNAGTFTEKDLIKEVIKELDKYFLCKYNNEITDYLEALDIETTDLVELKLTSKDILDYNERHWTFVGEVTE